MHGHALGAAGAIELVAAIGALRDGVIPPTANFIDADPECDLDYVPNVAREKPVRAVLSNSFAFGGLNSVVALARGDAAASRARFLAPIAGERRVQPGGRPRQKRQRKRGKGCLIAARPLSLPTLEGPTAALSSSGRVAQR